MSLRPASTHSNTLGRGEGTKVKQNKTKQTKKITTAYHCYKTCYSKMPETKTQQMIKSSRSFCFVVENRLSLIMTCIIDSTESPFFFLRMCSVNSDVIFQWQ